MSDLNGSGKGAACAEKARRATLFFYETDREAIQRIKSEYGVSTDSDAVRLALRAVLRGIGEIDLVPARPSP